MTSRRTTILWLLASMACLLVGTGFGSALERRLDVIHGPALLFTSGNVELHAHDDWTAQQSEGTTGYDASHRLEFKNVSSDPITIRVPPQVGLQGYATSVASFSLDDQHADSKELVLKPGDSHVICWNSFALMVRADELKYGLVYYQVAVYINDQLRIMGAKSELTIR